MWATLAHFEVLPPIKLLTQSCDDQDSIVLVLNVFQQNQFYLRSVQLPTADSGPRRPRPASSLSLCPQTDSPLNPSPEPFFWHPHGSSVNSKWIQHAWHNCSFNADFIVPCYGGLFSLYVTMHQSRGVTVLWRFFHINSGFLKGVYLVKTKPCPGKISITSKS